MPVGLPTRNANLTSPMDWFGFSKGGQVVPVAFSDGTLTFRSSETYKIGKSVKVQLLLSGADWVETPSVSLTVSSVEEGPDGSYLCVGALQLDAKRTQELKNKLTYAGVEGACRRGSRRMETMVRVLSKELPGFHAVTKDVSLTGVQLICDGPVPQGSYLNLAFDLDIVGFPELVMQAVCVRCADEVATSRNAPKCRMGVAFTPQHPQTHAAWAKFYDHLVGQEGASLMAKSLSAGGDFRPAEAESRGAAPPPPPPPPPPPGPSSPATPAPTYPSGGYPRPPVGASPPPPAQTAPTHPSGGYPSPPVGASAPPPAQTAPPSYPSGGYPRPPVGASPPSPVQAAPPSHPSGGYPRPPAGVSPPPPAAHAPPASTAPPASPTAAAYAPPAQAYHPPQQGRPPAFAGLTFDNLPPPSMPVSQPDSEPAPVQAMGIDGANFVFRALDDDAFLVGGLRQVEVELQHNGQWTRLVLSVIISRVEPAPSGLCMCWGTLREDALTVQMLNQSLG